MSIEVQNVTKTFGTFKALDNVTLRVPPGELVALLGPSGSGKTTLLRIMAGLEMPDPNPDSRILFHDKDVAERTVGERRVGFVFQHYALFRHMTVFENIAFGLRVRKRSVRPSNAKIEAKVRELLQLIQLEGIERRYPAQLSGGQRQRVALARALAIEPEVLLLDEPFGALDAKVRQDLRRWLRKLHDEIHVTSVFVTHDQEEALEVSDRIAVMNRGRIEQVGSPEEVFHHPATEFVMNFLGNVNLFHGRVESGRAVIGAGDVSGLAAGGADASAETIAQAGAAAPPDHSTRLFVRPHELEVLTRREEDPQALPGRIVRVQSAGPVVKVEVECDDGETRIVTAEIAHEAQARLRLAAGQEVFLRPRQAKLFFEDGAGI